jgi:two-component system cell cycle sensor histidine kinase PleC
MSDQSVFSLEPIIENQSSSLRNSKTFFLFLSLFLIFFSSLLLGQNHIAQRNEKHHAIQILNLARGMVPHHSDVLHILSKSSDLTMMKKGLRTLAPPQFLDLKGYFIALAEPGKVPLAVLPETSNIPNFDVSLSFLETAQHTPMTLVPGRSIWGKTNALMTTQILTPEGRSLLIGYTFHHALIPWSWSDLLPPFLCAFVIAGLATSLFASHVRKRVMHQAFSRLSQTMTVAFTRGRCGWWDWDIARGRIYWSHTIYALLGFQRERTFLSFSEFKDLIHPEDLDLLSLAQSLAAQEIQSIDHDFRIRNHTGQWVWVRTHAERVEDPIEKEWHVIGILSDASEHHSAAEKRAQADKRLREALDVISESFVLWDSDRHIVVANSKFHEIEGLCSEVISYQLQDHTSETELSLGETGASFEVAFSDGRWFQISEQPTKDGGFISVGTEITLLKQHEERFRISEKQLVDTISDLKQSRQALEAQTRQLSELAEKYLDQKAEAESANRAKSEFLANMSHEFRTPLNAILGFTQVMSDEIFGSLGHEKYVEYCRDIRRSGEYLLHVLNDILDMARLESGRIHLEKSEVIVNHLIQAALNHGAETAPEKKLTFSADIPLHTTIYADPHALQKILDHVISNAIKFSVTGGHIAVRVRRLRTAINIYVEDNGIGINAHSLKRLAQPFEHGWGEFDKTYRGPGLGLSVAKSLAELHGGNLRIRSLSGSGTIVLIHLPNYEAERSTAGLKLMAGSTGI